MPTHYLACDLGAESGRLMLGTLADGRLRMEELHRFPNVPQRIDGSLQWNLSSLHRGLLDGLKIAAARGLPCSSISTDAWGVDYVLQAPDGQLMTPAFHYRDARSHHGVTTAYSKVSWETIFAESGIQFLSINTIYQLMAEEPGRLTQAERLLGIGDSFNYLLCGQARAESSFASTTQLYNPVRRAWSERLLKSLQLPARLFPQIIPAGTVLGPLRDSVLAELRAASEAAAAVFQGTEVIATCSHDTGAAVVAVPAREGAWGYLSSGTWSLMGVELEQPIVTEQCRDLNFTNEIGYGHTVRLLRNIVGLWILQECRRHWTDEGHTHDYAALAQMAAASPAFGSLINPGDQRFLAPDEMPRKIADFCHETGQKAPATVGATVRCILESLALLYRRTADQIAQLVGQPLEVLHIVGGGSKNQLLNQFTANALQIPVLAGPVEATATGNVLVQALAQGHLESLQAAREIVGRSNQISIVAPVEAQEWAQAYERFENLSRRNGQR